MSTKVNVVAVSVAIGLLCGCAAVRPPVEIGVTDESFVVEGHALKTRDELAEAIRASGATECRVRPGPMAPYARVQIAFLAVRDAGCSSGIVGSVGP